MQNPLHEKPKRGKNKRGSFECWRPMWKAVIKKEEEKSAYRGLSGKKGTSKVVSTTPRGASLIRRAFRLHKEGRSSEKGRKIRRGEGCLRPSRQ